MAAAFGLPLQIPSRKENTGSYNLTRDDFDAAILSELMDHFHDDYQLLPDL